MKFGLTFVGLVLMSLSAKAVVWDSSGNQWNQAWEDKYSEWINTDFNDDIFTQGKWANSATDCADAVYFSRVIFAYENKLPFEMKDSSGGSQRITNRMSRWDGESELAKVKNFLRYVSDMGGTKTLPNDTYPVKILRQYVRSGTIWSRPHITEANFFRRIFGGNVKEDPGHAELVKNVADTGAVYLIGSTVPRAVRKLITTSSLVFMPIEISTGFRKWKQPSDYDQKSENLDGYSLEQFKMGASASNQNNSDGGFDDMNHHQSSSGSRNINQWVAEVQARLALRAESKEEEMQRFADNLCTLVQARVEIIQISEKYREKIGRCMNKDEYDSYSTPSRDKRIQQTTWDLLAMANADAHFLSPAKPDKVAKYLEVCQPIEYLPGKSMSLLDYVRIIVSSKESSNPNLSLLARWGLKSEDSSCQKFE